MAIVKKSISVTDQQNNWIRAQIESGHYGNESETDTGVASVACIRSTTASRAARSKS